MAVNKTTFRAGTGRAVNVLPPTNWVSDDPILALTTETTERAVDSIEVLRSIESLLIEVVLHLRTITNEDFSDEN